MPGPTSNVNAINSPALSDLGLGDQVSQQLQDQLDEQKKKKLMAAGNANMGATLGGATQSTPLNPSISPAVQMLFGDTR